MHSVSEAITSNTEHAGLSRSWANPFSASLFVPSSDYYGNMGALKQHGYRAMPQVEQTLADSVPRCGIVSEDSVLAL